jgi:hypothetical protein
MITDGLLVCPGCGGVHLRQRIVVAHVRMAEDEAHVRATVAMGGHVNVRLGGGEPSGRRDDVAVGFDCETCGGEHSLEFVQHKGVTKVAWREGL